jgi:hypothetical protein
MSDDLTHDLGRQVQRVSAGLRLRWFTAELQAPPRDDRGVAFPVELNRRLDNRLIDVDAEGEGANPWMVRLLVNQGKSIFCDVPSSVALPVCLFSLIAERDLVERDNSPVVIPLLND